MAKLLGAAADWSWPPELAEFDPAEWPEGRCEWHLARCDFAPDKFTKFQEIRAASKSVFPEARASGFRPGFGRSPL